MYANKCFVIFFLSVLFSFVALFIVSWEKNRQNNAQDQHNKKEMLRTNYIYRDKGLSGTKIILLCAMLVSVHLHRNTSEFSVISFFPPSSSTVIIVTAKGRKKTRKKKYAVKHT